MKKIEFLLGTFLLGSGIGICNQASWGMDPFDVMTTGAAAKYQISLSIINLSIYLLMCLVVYCLDRKQLSLWTCLAPFVTSFGIEVIMRNFGKMVPNGMTLVIYIFGMLEVALGTALSVEAEIGKSPYDCIFVIVMDSLGVGAMPDSADFGDIGVNTLGHISESVDTFEIPNFQRV